MLNGPKCKVEGLRLIIMKKSLNPRTNELLDTLLDSRLKLWLQQLIGQLAKIKLVFESYAVIYSPAESLSSLGLKSVSGRRATECRFFCLSAD